MINKDFKSILDLIKAFPDEQACINHLEQLRWNGEVVSPFDPTSKVYDCKGNKYKCKNTGKYFNVKTATLFDNSKIELQKWFIAIYLITEQSKGISSVQLAKDLNITQKSAWFMAHRIRNCFGISEDADQMKGEVEIEETYVVGNNINRRSDKKVDYSVVDNEKTPVMGMVQKGVEVRLKHVPTTKSEVLIPGILKNFDSKATIHTDEYVAYKSLERVYSHFPVTQSEGLYVQGMANTNTIEGFWSILKRGVVGIYHSWTNKYLQKYLDKFVFRYNGKNLNNQIQPVTC